jgi:hypothetical protein
MIIVVIILLLRVQSSRYTLCTGHVWTFLPSIWFRAIPFLYVHFMTCDKFMTIGLRGHYARGVRFSDLGHSSHGGEGTTLPQIRKAT